jgi:hypothetical protein
MIFMATPPVGEPDPAVKGVMAGLVGPEPTTTLASSEKAHLGNDARWAPWLCRYIRGQVRSRLLSYEQANVPVKIGASCDIHGAAA